MEFLLKTQNKDGSWGSARINRPDDIYAPVPGAHQAFRAAVTALCVSALIEIRVQRRGSRAAPSTAAKPGCLDHLPKVRRATPTRSTTSGPTPTPSRPWCGCTSAVPATPSAEPRSSGRSSSRSDLLAPVRARRRRLGLLRLRLPARRSPAAHHQLRHGHGAVGVSRGAADRRRAAAAAGRSGAWPPSAGSASPTSATATASTSSTGPWPDQPARRQPGPLASLQPGDAGLGRRGP